MKISRSIFSAAAIFALLAGAQSSAQQTETPPPPPPCSDEIFHHFDFWVGEWEVFGLQGKKAGENTITVEEYGCLLVEHWTAASGGTGQSYNFVDHASGKWRQIWVAKGATTDYSGGLNDAGEMVLEGTIGYPNGISAPFRGTWTLQGDGSVRQYFQQYDSAKEKWTDWFTGIYKKKKAAE